MQSGKKMRLMAGAMLVAIVPAHAERVGTAGAVNTRSVSTQPGGTERVMEIGAQVVRNERIETSASGSMQIMFIDKTSLTIGPNSKITIDEFVYNPTDGTGTMSVRLGRGLLRVVGGQVTHTGGATITTPAATIGVRGGVATVNHCAGQCDQPGTRATLHFGSLVVTPIGPAGSPTGAPQSITRPGFATFVAGQGQSGQANSASAPQRATQSEVGETNTALNSKRGQAGGATTKPTDQGAGNAGVGTNVPTDAGSIASRQGQNASGVTASAQTPANRTAQNAQQVAQQGTQGAAARATAGAMNATVSTPVTPPPVTSTAKTLVGFTGAIVKTSRPEQGGTSSPTVGRAAVVIAKDIGRVGATFKMETGEGETSKRVTFNFGSAPVFTAGGVSDPSQAVSTSNPASAPGRSLYRSDRLFGARAEVIANSSEGPPQQTSGFESGTRIASQMPQANTFNSVQSVFVTADAVGANSRRFLSRFSTETVRPCDCEYTRWGFWSASGNGSEPGTNWPISIDATKGTWVAGLAAKPIDMPTTGQATYVGQAVAAITNGGNSYLATGNFRNTVNFGTYSGQVAITGLDQTNYTGRVTYAPGSIAFGGTLLGDTGGRAAALNGLFYQGATGAAAKYGEMGGSIAISSSANTYAGAGTFAAKLTPGATPVGLPLR